MDTIPLVQRLSGADPSSNDSIVTDCWLVGGFNRSEKYEFVNGKDDIPYMKWKIKKCLKPPASW